MSGTAQVTVVAGACGGAGASLLAAALALAAAHASEPTWLLDLDHACGDTAAGWGAVGDRTTRDLLPVVGELTPAHVRHAARAHPSGVTLLAAPGVPGAADDWDPAATRALIAAAGAAAGPGGRVVVDAGTGLPSEGIAAAELLLACPPTLRGARRAAAVARAAAGRLSGGSCALVVVAGPGRGELGARALARLAGAPVAGALPWSPREATAIGSGRWPSGRRARLARAVRGLARGAA